MFRIIAGSDVVIASRYVEGGRVAGWGTSRRFMSYVGRLLAGPLVAVKDPMSGFFMVKSGVIKNLGFRPIGFKILLALIARSGSLSIKEFPYTFCDRKRGSSKMGIPVIASFAFQICTLYIRGVVK